MHIFCVAVLIKREIYVYSSANRNGMMKMFETLALILYMITLFGGSQLFFMMYYDQSASELKWIFPELNEM